MKPALAVIFGLFGLVFGSFANVVIYRVPLGRSIVRPGSACPACQAEVKASDNIPVLSWMWLRGRCRACKAQISIRYPLVELTSGALFALCALRFDRVEEAAFTALSSWVLLVLSVIDLDTRRIPNVIVNPATITALVAVVAMGVARGEFRRIVTAVGASAGCFAIMFLIAFVQPKGMGFGDVRLVRFSSLVLGWFAWPWAVLALMVGFVLGGMIGIVLLAAGKSRKTAIPFGPMLAAGALVVLFAGERMTRWWLG